MYFHHTITYPNGEVHKGKLDHSWHIDLLELKDVKDLTVLDIATNDGYFAFWAEQHGADEVTAIDIDKYQNYEWGFDGPPEDQIKELQQQDKGEVFRFHHENLNSKVDKLEMSIYDVHKLKEIDGRVFDVVFNYGLLYHLRNPIAALDSCRTVTNGFMVLETHINSRLPMIPFCFDCGVDTGLLTMTDNNWPTESCVASWLRKACYHHVFVQRGNMLRQNRQVFIGVVDEKWLNFFHNNDNFWYCDEEYWKTVRNATKKMGII